MATVSKMLEFGKYLLSVSDLLAVEKKEKKIFVEDLKDEQGRTIHGWVHEYGIIIFHRGVIAEERFVSREDREKEFLRIKSFLG